MSIDPIQWLSFPDQDPFICQIKEQLDRNPIIIVGASALKQSLIQNLAPDYETLPMILTLNEILYWHQSPPNPCIDAFEKLLILDCIQAVHTLDPNQVPTAFINAVHHAIQDHTLNESPLKSTYHIQEIYKRYQAKKASLNVPNRLDILNGRLPKLTQHMFKGRSLVFAGFYHIPNAERQLIDQLITLASDSIFYVTKATH